MMKDSDSVADRSDLIASLMEATGSPIENATLALQTCGGNKQKALELLLTGGGANFNDTQQSVSAGASKGAKVDEDEEMVQEHNASNVAARDSQTAEASVTREGGVPTPRPPQTSIFPGAVAVEGPDARGTDDERRFSFTSSSDSNSMSNQPTEVKPTVAAQVDPTVTARLVVDNSEDHLESLEERIQRQEQQLEELQRNQQNIVVGQVLGADNADGDEEEARSTCSRSSLCGCKRKMTIAVMLVLAVVAIVVGSVIATTGNTMSPPTAGLDKLLSSVSFDNGTALQTPSTPQNNALSWLASNPNLDTYSDMKKIQRYILAVLYYSTNGHNWVRNDGWLGNENECNWYNKADSFCNENGAVEALDLFSNNLGGMIPNELALLSDSLAKLSLWGNSLTGTIVREIGSLTRLTWLDLDRNRLKGNIPNQIGFLTILATLDLWGNSLTGIIPSEISSFTSLTYLDLSWNNLMGTIPTQIGILSQLTYVSLSGINLTGTIPTEIGYLTQLPALRLDQNMLMGSIPTEIGLLTQLSESLSVIWLPCVRITVMF
jgi:hypothetical protein